MNKISELIKELNSTKNIRFSRLLKICNDYFGKPRISGSHHIFRTPWPGDPRINLQKAKGETKPYQVCQVISALEKLMEMQNDTNKGG